MAIFFIGNEPEIFDSFTGSVTTDATVAIAGQNRAGVRFDQQSAVATFAPQTEAWFHCRFSRAANTSGNNNNGDVLFLQNAEGQNFFRLNANRLTSPTHTLIALTQPGVSLNIASGVLDVHFRIASSGGFIRAWVDGILQVNFSGNTLPPSGTASVSRLTLTNAFSAGLWTVGQMFSQFLVSDLPTLNARVLTAPLTVGTPNDWDGTPSNVTGTGFSGLANAIKEQVPEQRIRFTAADIGAISGTEFIGGVGLHASALAEVGTAVPRLGATAFNGTTETDIGTPQTKGTAFSPTPFLMNVNPNGGSAWTVSSFNAAEFALVAKA